MGIIDIWCNLFTADGLGYYLSWEENRGLVERWGKTGHWKGYTVDEFVALMDRHGVDRAFLLSQKLWSWKRKAAGIDVPVQAVADVVRQRPDRFSALYGVNPWTGLDGVRELWDVVKKGGFAGAHLQTHGFGLDLNDPTLYPFYAACAELDVPILVQTGHAPMSMPSGVAMPILLDQVAIDFPALRIVATHTGWPWVEEMIALAWKHPNVYIAALGHAPRFWDPSLVRFINTRGQGKVLWGSVFPMFPYEESLPQIDALPLKDAAKAALLGGAAATVFRL